MRKRILVLALAVTFLFSLPSCQPSSEEEVLYQEITVLGVTFTEEPKTVISLSPFTTEMILQLGLIDRLTGCTNDCVLPEEYKDIPSIGEDDTPDFELIISFKPDLVVSQRSLSKSVLDQLNQSGIKALVIPAAEDLRELSSYYAALACVFWGTEEGISKAENSLAPLVRVCNVLNQTIPKAEQKTFGYFPQFGKTAATSDTFAGNILSCLGKNAVQGSEYSYSFSQIQAANPDYLLVPTPYALENLASNPSWKELKAVQNGNVLSIDPSLLERQCPDFAEVLLELAKTIYPQKADEIEAALEREESSSGDSESEKDQDDSFSNA